MEGKEKITNINEKINSDNDDDNEYEREDMEDQFD